MRRGVQLLLEYESEDAGVELGWRRRRRFRLRRTSLRACERVCCVRQSEAQPPRTEACVLFAARPGGVCPAKAETALSVV